MSSFNLLDGKLSSSLDWPFQPDLEKSLNPNFKNMLLYGISKQQFSILPIYLNLEM